MDHSDIVRRFAEQFRDRSSEQAIGLIPLHVAWELRGEGCGLVERTQGGEGVFRVGDKQYSIKRVAYPDGRLIKILSDAGVGGTNGPQWSEEVPLQPGDKDKYAIAINPSLVDTPSNPNDPVIPADIEKRIKDLEDAVNESLHKIDETLANLSKSPALLSGDIISIRSASEKPRYLRYDWDKGPQFDRDEVKGPGEKFVIDKV